MIQELLLPRKKAISDLISYALVVIGAFSWCPAEVSSRNFQTLAAYDSGGAIVGSTQSTLLTGTASLTNYAFSYEYRANGVRKKMVYPSGREVEYDQDRRGRVVSAKGRAVAGGAQFDYVTAQSYHPHGALASVALGNGLTEEHCYNGRLQMTAMRLGTGGVGNCALATSDWWRMGLEYGATASANNGNVAEQTITARLDAGGHWTRKQVFSYDGVNRLKRVEEQQVSGGSATSWAVEFGYDRYGNQWVPTATTNVASPRATKMADYEAATNRIVKYWNDNPVPAGAYDGDGNWKDWLDVGVLTYDGENRVTKVVGASGTATFEYDGQGRRVRKTVGGVETTFVYDADGEVAAEYGGASTLTGRHFVTADHLGSTRVLTNVTGGRVHCADYLPFGEEIRTGTALSVRAGVGCYGTAGMERKFTGKERDAETGLDYFGARYLSSAQGRFISPDGPFNDQNPEDSLSWNLYSYVRNNPIAHVDENGEFVATVTGAIVGGVVGGAIEKLQGGSFWKGVAKGAVGGAIAGSVVDTGGASLGVLALSGAAGGVGSGIVGRAIEGRGSSAGDVMKDFAIGAATAVIGGKVGEAIANKVAGAVIQKAANEASRSVGAGSGAAHGTRVHSAMEGILKTSKVANAIGLRTEVLYAGGEVVKRGTPGSVRLDVVRGNPSNPGAVFDLKTGSASLTGGRLQQIQQALPKPLPVKVV